MQKGRTRRRGEPGGRWKESPSTVYERYRGATTTQGEEREKYWPRQAVSGLADIPAASRRPL